MNVQPHKAVSHTEHLSVLMHGYADIGHAQDIVIDHLTLDSRKVGRGGLFFAVPGTLDDGRQHMKSALDAGASAVVYEARGWHTAKSPQGRVFGVENLKEHVSAVADKFYGAPSAKLKVLGITGTNGKSTCAILTAQALESLNRRCGIVGTLGSGFTDSMSSESLTTPDAVGLQELMAGLFDRGANYLSLEVSSHALDQCRVSGVRFATVVLTNLTRDHLDYHRTLEHYRSSKARLFTDFNASCAVLNTDDAFGRLLKGQTRAEREITYGTGPSTVRLTRHDVHRFGVNLEILIDGHVIELESELLGAFNAMNLTAVAAMLLALDISVSEIDSALNAISAVTGRMERIEGGRHHPDAVIDYAHTPDGLESVLRSLRLMDYRNICCVFGCGGDRDREKRPLMGEIADLLADRVVLTDDNPRNESPAEIVDQIAAGMSEYPMVIQDRRAAIEWAIGNSSEGDVVLIAGKGHEQEQIYGSQRIRISDREIALEALGHSQ